MFSSISVRTRGSSGVCVTYYCFILGCVPALYVRLCAEALVQTLCFDHCFWTSDRLVSVPCSLIRIFCLSVPHCRWLQICRPVAQKPICCATQLGEHEHKRQFACDCRLDSGASKHRGYVFRLGNSSCRLAALIHHSLFLV